MRAGAPPSPRSRTPRPCAAMSPGSIPGSMTGLLSRAVCNVHPSSTRSVSTGRPIIMALKFSIRSFCHPGRRCSANSLVGGPVAAHADRRRRALEHVHVLRRLRERRHRLDPARADADDADDLVGQLGEVRVVRPAAGVLVVPPGGVERRALEVVHARDRRQLHEVEDAGRQDEVAGADLVAAVGADHPAGRCSRPTRSSRRRCGTARRRPGRTSSRSRRGAGGSRPRTRTASWGRSSSPRASACRCTTRRRTSRRGSGSSTRCPRCRRPCRSARSCAGRRRAAWPPRPRPTSRRR